MTLTDHARAELNRAGLFDEDSDYDGMLGQAVMELVTTFAAQGHSGFSAHQTIALFRLVASFEPLTPITSDPSEWMHVASDPEPCWQNVRRSTSFSRDGGQTWYDIDNPKLNNGDKWVRDPWRRRFRALMRKLRIRQ